MTPLEIKIAYITQGKSYASTARRAGCAKSLVSQIVRRNAWSTKVAKVIAEDIGATFEEVFPERVECPDRRLLSARCT